MNIISLQDVKLMFYGYLMLCETLHHKREKKTMVKRKIIM